MTSVDHDPELRQCLRALRVAPPPERARGAVHRAAEQGFVSPRGSWIRRAGGPAGLAAVATLAAGTAVAAATGTLGFAGLAGVASENDVSASDLRGLVDQLEQQAGGTAAVRSGAITRDGLDIRVALTDSQLCFAAPGQQSTTTNIDARNGRQDSERPTPSLEDVPSAGELRQRPVQVSCVSSDQLEGPLPAIAGADARGSWVVAVVPDEIHDVRATTTDDTEVLLQPVQNVATARATTPFTELSWITADGTTQRVAIGAG